MKKKYHVCYGETMPAWHKNFDTVDEVLKFVRRCLRLGDIVFRIDEVKE